MTNILLHGANGQMGQVIQKLACRLEKYGITGKIDTATEDCCRNLCEAPYYASLETAKADGDVLVDFSHPSALEGLLDFCVEQNLPAVIATTGLEAEHMEMIQDASRFISVFQSANMSVGINVMSRLSQLTARILEADFDIEIIERHHNKKIDSPSGTALLLADAINQVCLREKEYVYGRHSKEDHYDPKHLGIHAVRGGTLPGEHTVLFAGPDETIELTHRALSKEIFARGALTAATFISRQKSGLYSMKDIIEQ